MYGCADPRVTIFGKLKRRVYYLNTDYLVFNQLVDADAVEVVAKQIDLHTDQGCIVDCYIHREQIDDWFCAL